MRALVAELAPSRYARLRLLLALVACLGASLACVEEPDTAAHPFSVYDVQVTVSAPSEHATVDLQIDVQYQDQAHWLAARESIVCDGIGLVAISGSTTLSAAVPLRAPGSAYHCLFTSLGAAITLNITVPPLPRLVAPAPGATLARTASFTLAYAHGSGVAGSDVLAKLPGLHHSFLSSRQTGPDVFVVDPHNALRDFPAGPGSLDITTTVSNSIAATAGLKSLTATFVSVTSVPAIWT